MIYKIEIENFHSIRDPQMLDLRVPANAPQSSHRLASCWQGSTERAPKVVAVFGANSSGKSNLLRALSFLTWFMGSSFDLGYGKPIPYSPFKDQVSANTPTRLKIWLSGLEKPGGITPDITTRCQYCYELVISNGDQRNVISESIHYWPSSAKRKSRLIERAENGTVKAAKVFGLAGFKGVLEKVLRPNASVISTLAQLNHPFATDWANFAQCTGSSIAIQTVEIPDEMIVRKYIERPEIVEMFNREIGRIDVGIRALEITRDGEGQQVLLRHEGLALPMSTTFESHGTRQIMKLFPLIYESLENGHVLIIDELDAAIHSMILPKIISWFHDPDRNPDNAQLWLTCMNVSLLEDLSKDEIVFCEKDRQGRTELYGLNDIKGVRRDDNYYRKYLGGVYGAVPRIG